MYKIAVILPKGEGFSPAAFGAVSLCVRDFTFASRYHKETLVIGGMGETGFDGVEYAFIPPAPWYQNRTRYYIRQCARAIAQHNIKLAEIHNRPHLLTLLSKKAHCRFALHLHNDPQEMQDCRTPKEREKILALCKAVYCVSYYIRNRFLEGLDARHAGKVHVIYNGLFLPQTLPEKEKIIVFAGRMTEGKGAKLLAEALATLLPTLPEWKAVIIGSRRHSTSKKLSDYERETLQWLEPLREQAQMPGFLSHEATLDYFARAEIAVVPSVWAEPFGRTALEAMAMGCALISSGKGGLKEITLDNAFTLDTLSADTLKAALLLLTKNAQKRLVLQRLAYARASAFTITEVTKTLDAVRDAII